MSQDHLSDFLDLLKETKQNQILDEIEDDEALGDVIQNFWDDDSQVTVPQTNQKIPLYLAQPTLNASRLQSTLKMPIPKTSALNANLELGRLSELRGVTLIDLRTRCNFSIQDMSRLTRITQKHIEALEQEQYHLLPASVYVRGFLNSYLKIFGFQNPELVSEFVEKCRIAQIRHN